MCIRDRERIPTIIDQYKSKNEVLEKESPQLQERAGKVGKKEDELKQRKSELAALDRKIQLELAPAQENTEENRQGNLLISASPLFRYYKNQLLYVPIVRCV